MSALTWEEVGAHVNENGRLTVEVSTPQGVRPGLADSTSGLLVDGQWVPRPVLDLMRCAIRRVPPKNEREEARRG